MNMMRANGPFAANGRTRRAEGWRHKRFDRMNKIFKMNKIVLHPNLVNRANHVNPVKSTSNPNHTQITGVV